MRRCAGDVFVGQHTARLGWALRQRQGSGARARALLRLFATKLPSRRPTPQAAPGP